MGKIKYKTFLSMMSSDTNKGTRTTSVLLGKITERIFREMIRGNSVEIERFGTFEPKFVGGYKEDKNGESVYVEPRVGVEFNLSKAGMQILNNDIFDADSKKRIRDGNLFPYEKEILGMDVTIKMPLEEAWNKIMEGKD